MLQSMTGFGRAEAEFRKKRFIIEIKTVNSKQFDAGVRLPGLYKELEMQIRSMLTKQLLRGKIDLNVKVETTTVEEAIQPNSRIIHRIFTALKENAADLNIQIDENQLFQSIIQIPDIFSTDETETLCDAEAKAMLSTIENAVDELKNFRKQEGRALETDIVQRIALIQKFLNDIDEFEKQRILNIKTRIQNNLTEFFDELEIDQNRFEQELLYYLDKLDITEEKVRLNKHCYYFLETIKKEENTGRKLGFISQEIGREINTIGAKANDADIQKIVVMMKDEQGKIKEQLMNVL